jgi:hypothetical protein
MRRTVQDVMTSARHRGERQKAGGTTAATLMTAPAVTVGPEAPVDGAVAGEARVGWAVDDTAAQASLSEPVP